MTQRRALRATAFGSAVVVATALIVIVVLTISFVRRPLPERSGEIELAGLRSSVTVLRDDRAIPRIYADNPIDLFRAQGYVNAEDRFFEMDLRRHVTAGRLSELVGRNTEALRSDTMVRTLGWRLVAEQELAEISPDTRSYLEAYAAGVNDYLRGRSASELSLSYTVLGRANPLQPIEPWTPVDSLSWLKAMAWDLRSNYDEELERARTIATVRDVDRVEQLYPTYPYGQHEPIIPGAVGNASASLVPEAGVQSETAAAGSADDTTDPGSGGPGRAGAELDDVISVIQSDAAQEVFEAASQAVHAIPALLGRGEGIGSNSWVVSGDLTASGLPLLANDPHLKVSMPGVWTQVGLHCRTVTPECPFDVAGFGFAGMPGVVIGHNARISWGMTNLYPDVTDFYLERIDGDRVERDGEYEPLTIRTETIRVAGSQPVEVQVRSSRHGPVISDVLTEVAPAGRSAPVEDERVTRQSNYAVSLAWTALQPGTAMDALLELNVATNFTEFRAAVRKLDAPAQNVIYADVDGHIGYQAPGRIPIRGPGSGENSAPVPSDGTWPHPGWDSAYDWTGFVPVRDLPWVEDPEEGFIVAANQAVTGPGGSPQLTSDWDYGYRSQRIRDLILQAQQDVRPLTVEDMRAIQTDTHNGIAELLVPLLLRISIEEENDPEAVDVAFTQEAVDLLRDWDYNEQTDSAAAAYFNVVWATILRLTFADEMPDGFKPDGGDRWFEVVRTLLSEETDQWWDDRTTTDVVESRDGVLRRAMVSARLELTTRLGKDPERWNWGRLHRVTLEQAPLGGPDASAVQQRMFDRGPYLAPGGSSIVNAFSWDAASGNFDVTSAPSMRMIVDLSNFDQSTWVNQTGTSGHPGDAHYDDQVQAWLNGEDYLWPFSQGAVEAVQSEVQTFRPSATEP